MTTILRRLLLVTVSIFFIAACEGDDGAAGAAGAPGGDGAAGAAGLACWDLDGDGVQDPEEDLNGDGVWDALDCREPLPNEDIAVSGKVSNTAGGQLDRFTSVYFVPAAAAAAAKGSAAQGSAAPSAPPDAIFADVAQDGTYEIALDEGDYDANASRPGYEDASGTISVTQAGPNVLDFSLPEVPDGEYITSEQCGICHTDVYSSFIQTGHPYKLNKVIDGQQPTYPFTTLTGVLERVMDDGADIIDDLADPNGTATDNPLGTPMEWADVSYVIGGYFWKARFVDQNGAIVTGTEVQYNFATDELVAYHNNEADKNYNCGNCHTTGWVHTEEGELGQDGLKDMQGTFSEGGVHCEACHAAGAKHAKFRGGIVRDADPRTLVELTADDAGFGLAVACGECHTRDGERDYATYLSGFDKALAAADPPVEDTRPTEMGGRILASKGLIRHHEQYDEIVGINPDTLLTTRSGSFFATHGDCNTCHNPHGSSVNVNNESYTGLPGHNPSSDACLGCHGSYDPALTDSGSMTGLDCADCHMPKLAKSAVVSVAAEADRPAQGDVTSHIFAIELNTEKGQFTDDGKFAYPAIDEAWACRTCHNTAPNAVAFGLPTLIYDDYTFHDNIVENGVR